MNRERMCSLPKQRELNRGDNIAVVQQSKFTDVCHPDGRKDPAQGLGKRHMRDVSLRST